MALSVLVNDIVMMCVGDSDCDCVGVFVGGGIGVIDSGDNDTVAVRDSVPRVACIDSVDVLLCSSVSMLLEGDWVSVTDRDCDAIDVMVNVLEGESV